MRFTWGCRKSFEIISKVAMMRAYDDKNRIKMSSEPTRCTWSGFDTSSNKRIDAQITGKCVPYFLILFDVSVILLSKRLDASQHHPVFPKIFVLLLQVAWSIIWTPQNSSYDHCAYSAETLNQNMVQHLLKRKAMEIVRWATKGLKRTEMDVHFQTIELHTRWASAYGSMPIALVTLVIS